MSKKTHQKELARARAKRRAAARTQRDHRRIVAAVVVLLLGLGTFVGVLSLRDRGDGLAIDDGATDPTATDAASDPTEAGAEQMVPQPVDAEPCEPAGAAPAPRLEPYDDVPATVIDEGTTYTVTLETTCGDIVLQLDPSLAPTAVNAFVALAGDGYYEGVPFHRTINGFMIQGGDPTGTGTGCVDEACSTRLPGYTFPDELDATADLVAAAGGYPRGTVAMANAGPDTNGSQFFIVQAEPGYPLPPDYVAFGTVLQGMDVVDRIANGPTDGQVATEPTVILSATVEPAA